MSTDDEWVMPPEDATIYFEQVDPKTLPMYPEKWKILVAALEKISRMNLDFRAPDDHRLVDDMAQEAREALAAVGHYSKRED